MIILGDNLAVMKILLTNPKIARKVRLVYIDPPFGTNGEFHVGHDRTATVSYSRTDEPAYYDRVTGEDYLQFLKARLILLRELLAEDGSIYIHTDCKMGHYVKVLADGVFGKDHFMNDITRIKCNPKNFRRQSYGNVKDMLLFYSKGHKFVWNEPRVPFTEEEIARLFPKVDNSGRRYTTTPLHAPGETVAGPTGKAWKGLAPPKGRHWRYSPDELTRLEEAGLIEWSNSGNPRKKTFADEARLKGKLMQDVWEFKDPAYPCYPTEKNLDMLKLIVSTSSNPGDIVLDCFAGSGTTLVAAAQLGRRWIGIDNSRAAIDIAMKRLAAMKASGEVFVCISESEKTNRTKRL